LESPADKKEAFPPVFVLLSGPRTSNLKAAVEHFFDPSEQQGVITGKIPFFED